MSYVFENIGNLDKAEISLVAGKVNIKYGFNGIGKSTIVKGIRHIFGNPDEQANLNTILNSQRTGNPFVLPSSDMKADFDSILVYDRFYFEKLFKQTDLLNNTYEFLINGSDYQTLLTPVINDIDRLKNIINDTNYISLYSLLNSLGSKSLIKYKQDGSVAKSNTFLVNYAMKNISISEDIPEDLNDYESFIKSEYRTGWNKWISDSKKEWYALINRCPFCGKEYDGCLSDTIDSLVALRSKGDYAQYDKEQA